MTEHSQNGWIAPPKARRDFALTNGVEFVGGIVDNDDVAAVLGYVVQQVNDRVEKAVDPGCWGYSYRPDRNDPNSLSNHASGTAVDFNAPKHPNGVPTLNTWSIDEVSEIHRILAEVDGIVRWGGDYHSTPDSMHFEINASAAAIAAAAKKLGDDMPYSDWPLDDRKALATDVAKAVLDQQINAQDDGEAPFKGVTVRKLLKALFKNAASKP